jgi:hydrogenase expression/formation protein HypD
MLVRMRKGQKADPGKPCKIVNQYIRAVDNSGNLKALNIMREVFMPADACWRGLGVIPESGLAVRDKYAAFDAYKKFDLYSETASNGTRSLGRPEIKGCCCGRILKGAMNPVDCPLFGTACTPEHPIGPCMVSSEGSCAASYKYV